MAKTNLYVIRHGKTMFNTMGRAQGWSDTPLTPEGERGIQALGIGLREAWTSLMLIPVILDAPFRPWGLFSMSWD